MYIYGSYRKIKTGVSLFWTTREMIDIIEITTANLGPTIVSSKKVSPGDCNKIDKRNGNKARRYRKYLYLTL